MIAIWTGRYVQQACRLKQADFVPFAFGHHSRFAGHEVYVFIGGGLAGHSNRAANHIEQFIAVGVQLAVVWWVLGEVDNSQGHTR